jgi:protein SCO1/2
MKARYVFLGVGVILGVCLAVVGWQLTRGPYQYQGSFIDPPVQAPDFQLTSSNGESFQLSNQRGKAVLLFFGYTHCPDVCPVTLAVYGQIREKLGNLADQVEFVFITVDPERDTPEKIAAHLKNFDPAIVGLSGDQSALDKAWKDYGVLVEKQTGSGEDYLVDHTARTYVVDAQGNLRLTYTFGTQADTIVEDLLHLQKVNP